MSPPRFDRPGDRAGTVVIDLNAQSSAVHNAIALFARASAYLARMPRVGSARGYRLFWLVDGQLCWRDVVADRRSHVVVGRHPQVDVQLDGDGAIALRHLVFRATELPDAAIELRVLDLGATTPLLIDGSEELSPSAAVRGPLIASLGAHALCALPHDACQSTDVRDGRPHADHPDAEHAADLASAADAPMFARNGTAGTGDRSRTLIRTMTASTPIEAVEGAATVPWVEIRLTGQFGKACVLVAREQLDGMVLVGRYERCISGPHPVFSDRVSRVHLGIIRSGDAVEVLDLGSTNGIVVAGRRVRRALVENRAVFRVGTGRELVDISVRK